MRLRMICTEAEERAYVERTEQKNRKRLWFAYRGTDERDECRLGVPVGGARENYTRTGTVRQVSERCDSAHRYAPVFLLFRRG